MIPTFSPLYCAFIFFWPFEAAGFALVDWKTKYLCTWFLFFLMFQEISCLSPSSGFLTPNLASESSFIVFCVLCYLSVGCLSQAKSKYIPTVFKNMFLTLFAHLNFLWFLVCLFFLFSAPLLSVAVPWATEGERFPV